MATKKDDKKVVKKEMVTKAPKEPKQISSKTALIVVIVLLVIVGLAVYLYKWYDVKKEEKLMNSYLLTTDTISLEIKNLEEIPQIFSEAPTEYFVLINYTGNDASYNLEEGLKSIIDNYKLSDQFYYLNVTNIIEEDNYLARLNSAFNTDKITAVPTILYYKNNELVETVTRIDKNPINSGDFQKLIDIYEFEGQ